jgi:hypothetical protein
VAGEADVGIIFHHLARYFANAYPQVCAMVTVPGAEQFSSTIAMVSTIDPLRAKSANAFAEYFLGVARTLYPRYGFARMTEAEYGAPLTLRRPRRSNHTCRQVTSGWPVNRPESRLQQPAFVLLEKPVIRPA